MNEIRKLVVKRSPASDRPRPEPAGRSWVDRFAGTLDEEFARGALDRPGPTDQPDTHIG
jgi:hypothetical protein